jgi:hypothetical protein
VAGTIALQPPPANFNSHVLATVPVMPAALCRVSRHETGEPHFGSTGANRFDDNNPDKAARFGTCYFGLELAVAFAESVLHNAVPTGGRFEIPTSEIETRFALSFKGPRPLRLARLYGMELLLHGGCGELSGTPDYTLPQAWAAAVAGHPQRVDGAIYMSRRLNDKPAIVLFQRPAAAPPGIQSDKAVALHRHRDFQATKRLFKIRMT